MRGDDCFVGEVGLTGEVRRVSKPDIRIQEAEKLGFNRIIMPKSNLSGIELNTNIEVIGVTHINEALKLALQ